ncbi:MAG: TlpA family protein disulfide reductase [Prevotellaceae bacterium]|nr:TlpA family protein disulfide reductase [Candidatus Minthosoma caballi]
MKRTTLTLLMVLCVVCGWAQKNDVVWETPSALCNLGSSSAEFSVTKVELKDDETVMHVHAEFIPHYWIKFASDSFLRTSDGKQYNITNGKPTNEKESLIEMDSLFWMDDSGKAELALHFQPVPKDAKEIDFIEGYGEGAFRFWNIHEKGKNVLPKELQNMKYKNAEVLPDAKIHKGTATVRFKMVGYKPEMNLKVVIWDFEPLASCDDLVMEVPFNEQGIAVAEIPLHLVRTAFFDVANKHQARCLIAPGETTECIIVPEAEEKERFLFNGFMARTNTEIYRESIKEENASLLYDDLQKCTTGKERIDYLERRMQTRTAEINKRKDLAESSKQLLRMNAEYEFDLWATDFQHKYYRLSAELGKITPAKNAEEYSAYMKEFAEMLNLSDCMHIYDLELECVTAPYATCSPEYWSIFPYKRLSRNYPARELTFNESILAVKCFINQLDAEAYGFYMDNLTDPDCKAVVDEYNAEQERIRQSLSRQNNTYYLTLDDIAPEQTLSTILEKYKGKTVLVDVWATWCGPCRQGHKAMAPVKEELKGQDIVYVYISAPSSPLATWQKMIPEIPGEHYFINQKQYDYIMSEIYHSDGIPTYGIYDREGNQTFTQIGFSGAEKLKEELQKAMKY